MKHLFVSYAIAMALKKKGFDEPCFKFYDSIGGYEDIRADLFNWNQSDFTSIPLYQQAVDWFRDKHDINIDNNNNYSLESYFWKNGTSCGYGEKLRIKKYSYNINRGDFQTKYYANPYDALNEAILKAIKLIK